MQTMTRAELLGTPVHILDHLGRRWLTARDVGRCLGYAEDKASQSINNLHARHADEFGPEDTFIIRLMTNPQGGNPNTRIFSQTGCVLLAMFASTPRAKAFRAWAKAVLAGTIAASVATRTMNTARVSRALERQVMELFVAGLAQSSIARHVGLSTATVWALLNGKWRFALNAGADETTPELIAAVVTEHRQREEARIVAQYCQSATNQPLVAALDAMGRQLLGAVFMTGREG